MKQEIQTELWLRNILKWQLESRRQKHITMTFKTYYYYASANWIDVPQDYVKWYTLVSVACIISKHKE